MNLNNKKFLALGIIAAVALLILSACSGGATPAPTEDVPMIQTKAAQTIVADLTLAVPSATPTLAPPPGPTPDPNVPVQVLPTPAAGEPSATANYNTLIYGGPGLDYVVYTAFNGGSAAKVVGKNSDASWWTVSIPVAPNGIGWVQASWVTVANVDGVPEVAAPPVPPTAALVPPGPDDPQATTLVNAFVRSGPSSNYPAYGSAPAGATAWVIGKSEDKLYWVVRIDPPKVGAGYGWVLVSYTQAKNVDGVLIIANPGVAQPVVPAPPAAGVPIGIAVEPVNVRTGPGTNYPVIGVAQAAATGEITGKSSDGAWWQVKVPPTYSTISSGWVSASYVITENTGSVPVVAAPPAPPPVGPTPPPIYNTQCYLVSQTPVDGTFYSADFPFSTTWVLKNTGTTNWLVGEYDVVFMGSYNNVALHTGPDVYDLTTQVNTGSSYSFSVPMLAPWSMGQFGEMWQIEYAGQSVCQFYVYIQVK